MKGLTRSGLLALCLLAAAVPALAAPITFNTALPVARGQGIFRAQFQYLTASDNGPGNRDLEAWATPLVGVYGLTEKWALFGIVPYLDKELEVNTPLGRRTRDVSGLGDATFLARYTAFQRDRPGQTLRLAPFAGLKTPTGEDDESDSLGRLPQPLQLGSGSGDPFFGAVATLQSLERQFDAALSYRLNTEANDFELGDVARLDFSWQERLRPRKLGPGVPAFVYGVLEGNLLWQDRNRIGSRNDPDSGGTTLFIAPGLQHVTKRTVLEAAVQLPVIQDLHGDAPETDYVAILSFRMNL
jgi:hypothetical protein